jgi:hypothetical protein
MGIYAKELLDCGCEIRKYLGGRIIQSGCNTHRSSVSFKCPSCAKDYDSKAELTRHKWAEHVI